MLKNWTQTNIWMSLSITLLTASFYLFNALTSISYIYLITVFLASNSVYHFHRLIRNLLIGESTFQERDLWLKKHQIILWIWVGLSGVTSVLLFLYQGILFTKTTFILFISVLFYVVPFIRIKHQWIKLRDIPFFKIFLVAFIWAMVSVYLPFELSQTTQNFSYWYQFLFHTLLIFGITLPFDIRDLKVDTSKTFANTLGVKNTRILSIGILLIWIIFGLVFKCGLPFSIGITGVYSIYLILKTKETSSPIHFAFYLESIPIVYFLIFYLEFNIKSYF